MRRSAVFSMRVDRTERRMIAALARRLQRSRSDAVRMVIREAASALFEANSGGQGPASAPGDLDRGAGRNNQLVPSRSCGVDPTGESRRPARDSTRSPTPSARQDEQSAPAQEKPEAAHADTPHG
jgi:hypothetical protein